MSDEIPEQPPMADAVDLVNVTRVQASIIDVQLEGEEDTVASIGLRLFGETGGSSPMPFDQLYVLDPAAAGAITGGLMGVATMVAREDREQGGSRPIASTFRSGQRAAWTAALDDPGGQADVGIGDPPEKRPDQ